MLLLQWASYGQGGMKSEFSLKFHTIVVVIILFSSSG